ncbi:MAG TPA: hypothetical protein VJR03_05575 [Nitrospira sp.]|nr:hypothetical protein [Nitrospira sp.]
MEHLDKKIARFLKASNELERYLLGDGSLTPLQRQTIETTIMGLQTLMATWTRKNQPEGNTFLSQVKPRKAQGS